MFRPPYPAIATVDHDNLGPHNGSSRGSIHKLLSSKLLLVMSKHLNTIAI